MEHSATTATTVRPAVTLPARGIRAISMQAVLLICASFLLPAAAHLLKLPVRWILPMHWAVLLAGLCYGWRSGAAVGMAAPSLSYLLSGMPLPTILPAMTVELAVYGLVAGFTRQSLRWNAFAAMAAALIVGRLVFLAIALMTGVTTPGFLPYARAAMLPGLVTGLLQLLLLPLVARWWVARERAA